MKEIKRLADRLAAHPHAEATLVLYKDKRDDNVGFAGNGELGMASILLSVGILSMFGEYKQVLPGLTLDDFFEIIKLGTEALLDGSEDENAREDKAIRIASRYLD